MDVAKAPGDYPFDDLGGTLPTPPFGSSAYGPSLAVDYLPDNRSYYIAWTGLDGHLNYQTL